MRYAISCVVTQGRVGLGPVFQGMCRSRRNVGRRIVVASILSNRTISADSSVNGIKQRNQGCQMVYFQTKNTIFDEFWRALDRKMLIYFMAIRNILRTIGTL
jgi:hypothetical protein